MMETALKDFFGSWEELGAQEHKDLQMTLLG